MFNVANNLVREAVTIDEGTSRIVALGMMAFLYLVNIKGTGCTRKRSYERI